MNNFKKATLKSKFSKTSEAAKVYNLAWSDEFDGTALE